MEHPDITFHEDGNFVSIWVGSFGSSEAAEPYFAPHYSAGPEDDDRPISAFAADIGLKHYDEDFYELNFEVDLSAKRASTFAGHSFAESFAAVAWEAAQAEGETDFDTVIMLYGYNHSAYPQAARRPERVRFLGTFAYVAE